jgi:hypothetical protein
MTIVHRDRARCNPALHENKDLINVSTGLERFEDERVRPGQRQTIAVSNQYWYFENLASVRVSHAFAM